MIQRSKVFLSTDKLACRWREDFMIAHDMSKKCGEATRDNMMFYHEKREWKKK